LQHSIHSDKENNFCVWEMHEGVGTLIHFFVATHRRLTTLAPQHFWLQALNKSSSWFMD